MLFYRNVLGDQTIQNTVQETKAKFTEPVWRVNQLFWQKQLLEGINGAVYIAYPSEQLRDMIVKDIAHLLPPCNALGIDLCIWDKGSALNIHNDSKYNFGATIYLNQNWKINYGGLFGYEQDDQFRIFVPEFNTMVINNSSKSHFVTPISYSAPEYRVTIQIWGETLLE